MLVIGITATLLGMMMYRHAYTLTRATFNQDVELFASTLKETGTSAKKRGVLMINNTANYVDQIPKYKQESKQTTTTQIIPPNPSKYCLWTIKEKANKDKPAFIRTCGLISKRAPVVVETTGHYTQDKSMNINIGVWVDLYSVNDPKDLDKVNSKAGTVPDSAVLLARIVFEPSMLPLHPGIINIGLAGENSKNKAEVLRWQRIDIERSGVITVNTDDKNSSLATKY